MITVLLLIRANKSNLMIVVLLSQMAWMILSIVEPWTVSNINFINVSNYLFILVTN